MKYWFLDVILKIHSKSITDVQFVSHFPMIFEVYNQSYVLDNSVDFLKSTSRNVNVNCVSITVSVFWINTCYLEQFCLSVSMDKNGWEGVAK